MTSPLNAVAKSPTANSYVTVARANQILRARLYTTAWDNAAATPDAANFVVDGDTSLGSTVIAITGGTGSFTVGAIISFGGGETEYTLTAASSSSLTLSAGLTTALLDGVAVNRLTANTREKALMWATQILEAVMEWYGVKRTTEQALWFPASGVVNQNGDFYDFDLVPAILEVATVELALDLLASNKFALPAALGKGVSEVALGPLKAKIDASMQESSISDNILSLLSDLGKLEPEAQKGGSVVPLLRV